jgi:hypothetical protein
MGELTPVLPFGYGDRAVNESGKIQPEMISANDYSGWYELKRASEVLRTSPNNPQFGGWEDMPIRCVRQLFCRIVFGISGLSLD